MAASILLARSMTTLLTVHLKMNNMDLNMDTELHMISMEAEDRLVVDHWDPFACNQVAIAQNLHHPHQGITMLLSTILKTATRYQKQNVIETNSSTADHTVVSNGRNYLRNTLLHYDYIIIEF